MFEQDDHILGRVVGYLRRPVHVDPALEGRVLRQIAGLPVPRPGAPTRAWRWLRTPRRIAITPLGGLALAAGLAAVLLVRPGAPAPEQPTAMPFQFVVVAPGAASVALVGDFNDWDPLRTPMAATGADVWTAVLPLSPGRYRYAFLLDGSEWRADPAAPAGGNDGFGAPSSVVTVGGA